MKKYRIKKASRKIIKEYTGEFEEIKLPDKPFYCFQGGTRRSIRVIPVKDGLEITFIYLSNEIKMEKHKIFIKDFEDAFLTNSILPQIKFTKEVLLMFKTEDYYIRKESDFENDFQEFLKRISDNE